MAFFSQKFNIDFTVYAHKIASFSKLCDVIQDSHPFSKYLSPRIHFGTSIMANIIQKENPPFLTRPEPISNTVYNTLE